MTTMYSKKFRQRNPKIKLIRIGMSDISKIKSEAQFSNQNNDSDKGEPDVIFIDTDEKFIKKNTIQEVVVKDIKKADIHPLLVEEIQNILPICEPLEPAEEVLESLPVIKLKEPVQEVLLSLPTLPLNDVFKIPSLEDKIQLITYMITIMIASFVGGCFVSSILINF